jgi:hypothetical protein
MDIVKADDEMVTRPSTVRRPFRTASGKDPILPCSITATIWPMRIAKESVSKDLFYGLLAFALTFAFIHLVK